MGTLRAVHQGACCVHRSNTGCEMWCAAVALPCQELGVAVAACRKQVLQTREEVSARASSLASRGWTSAQQQFLADLLWEEVAFNTGGRKTLIAIASCCDEPDWAHELLTKFRIFDPSKQRLSQTMAEAIASQDLVQILHENKTQHHKHLKKASGIGFEEMLFFDDQSGNIRSVRSLGVLSMLTEGDDGVSWPTFVEGLRQFNAR
jgi:hypothetical protein